MYMYQFDSSLVLRPTGMLRWGGTQAIARVGYAGESAWPCPTIGHWRYALTIIKDQYTEELIPVSDLLQLKRPRSNLS